MENSQEKPLLTQDVARELYWGSSASVLCLMELAKAIKRRNWKNNNTTKKKEEADTFCKKKVG